MNEFYIKKVNLITMKKLITFLSLFFMFVLFGQVNPNYHKVKGYYRSDGTYVQPYYRTNPNNTNQDNYSTKPNVNPHTGRPGYIEPDHKPNSSTSTTLSSTSDSTEINENYSSTISFYTNYGQSGHTKIWINGSYKGKLVSYFSVGTPVCGQSGTLLIKLSPGTYFYRAEDEAGFFWEGSFTATTNNCQNIQLRTSAERRYDLGILRAKENYQTAYLNYLVPFSVTALNPYAGAGITLTVNLFQPYYNKSGDINFDKAYKRVARKKKIVATVISFGLGILTHELIKDDLN